MSSIAWWPGEGGLQAGCRALRGIGPTDVFEGLTDSETVEVPIDRLENVHDLVGPDERLVEVEVVGAVGDPSRWARLTFLRVERSHLATDRHAVALWASGDAFSGPPTPRTPSEYAATYQQDT